MNGILETIARHRAITAVAAIIAIIAAAASFYFHRPPLARSWPPTKADFTTDDGATLFNDDADKIPPYDHGGKEAVLAAVYTCDGGAHKWVQYLAKYEAAQKQALEADAQPVLPGIGVTKGLLVKRPDGGEWVSMMNTAASDTVCRPVCPEGMGTGPIERVTVR